MKFSGEEKGHLARFLSSKGFYVALAVCLIGASGATWMAVNRTINSIENQNNQLLQSEGGFVNFPQLEEVERRQPGVPREDQFPVPERSEPQAAPSYSPYPPQGAGEQQEQPPESSEPPAPQILSYVMPMRGQITKPFSGDELVWNATMRDWRTHNGVDIEGTRGDNVYASADGVITEISDDPLWGTTVVISHPDGNETIYSGLSGNLPISQGDTVTMRQVIGRLEGVPAEITSGIHLHYAMRRDGVWIDPLEVKPRAD